MPARTVYAGTLWWTDAERDLLELKLAESAGYVDRWIISQATTTLRGFIRELTLPFSFGAAPPVYWRTVDTSYMGGQKKVHCRHRLALQRNSLIRGLELQPDDVFIFSDLDEIAQKQDYPAVLDAVAKHGYVWLCMRGYRGRIDMQDLSCGYRGQCCAFSGAWWNQQNMTLHDLRLKVVHRNAGHHLKVRGQHFSWLYKGDEFAVVKHKLQNLDHPEWDTAVMSSAMQHGEGRFACAEPVPVDDSYPATILNNMALWSQYMEHPSKCV